MIATTIAKTKNMSREKWLSLRKKGIGGSDAAAILGVNPWKSAMDVWLEKTGEFEVEDNENERMYWGTVLEDVVAKEFTKRTGFKVRRCNSLVASKTHPFMLASVDRLLIGLQAGLECKTAGSRSADDWEHGIPEYYLPQVKHYMAVTRLPVWFVAVLIGGQEFRHYRVDWDDRYISDLIRQEENFWQTVITNSPPALDGTKASTELVKRLYPEAEKGKAIELPFEAFELVQKYEQFCEEEKQVLLRKDEAANQLKNMLGEAERGTVHGRQVIWQNVASKKFDGKALQKEHPDMYEFYSVPSNYRRFSVK